MKTIEMATDKEKAFNLFLDDIYTDVTDETTDAEKINLAVEGNTDAAAEISYVPNTDAAKVSPYVAIWDFGDTSVELARREYKTTKGVISFIFTAIFTGVGINSKTRPAHHASIETGNGEKLARVYVEDNGDFNYETFTGDMKHEIENWLFENRRLSKKYYADIAAKKPAVNLAIAENTDVENVTFNLATDAPAENDTDAENDNLATDVENDNFDVETVLSISAAAVTDAIYVSIDATALDKYIAIFKQGDMFMKKGMALKMIALALIDFFNLYTEKGYNNVYAFAEGELQLAKQTARRYLQTATQFYDIEKIATDVQLNELLDENGNFKKNPKFAALSIFADNNGNDFTPGALQAITAISVDDIKSLLASGELTYDMTVPEIRNAVSKYRKSAKKAARAAKLATTDATDDTSAILATDDTDAKISYIPNTDAAKKPATDAGNDSLAKALALIAKLQAENDELRRVNESYENRIDELQAENEKLKTTIDTITVEYEDRLDNLATDAENDNLATDAENDTNDTDEILDMLEVGNINPAMKALYEKMKLAKIDATDATDVETYSPALATYVFVDATDDTDANC